MNDVVNAEYKIIQERTLPVIASEIIQIEKTVCAVALEGAVQIGQKLHEAKEKVPHGEWDTWCGENLNYSYKQATRFMKLATEYGNEKSVYSNLTSMSDLSITKALEILQVPEEDVEKFVEEHDVEDISVRELKAEIEKLKEAKAASEGSKNDALGELAESRKEIENLQIQLKEKSDASEVNTAELDKLQRKLDAEKKKVEKAEKKFDEIAESTEKALEEAKEEHSQQFEEEIESLKKKLAASQDSGKVKFSIHMANCQESFNEALMIMQSADKEEREKYRAALTAVLASLQGKVE